MTNLTITPVTLSRLGVNITGATGLTSIASNTGVTFINPGNVGLVIYNGSASTITATPTIAETLEGVVPVSTTLAVSILTLNYMMMGPFSPLHFNTPGSPVGSMTVVFATAATTIAVGLIAIPLITP
jgi:hypothetical protein